MAIVKDSKKETKATKSNAKAKKQVEVVEEEVMETIEVEADAVSTNPLDYTYTVRLDSKKYEGRNAEQVDALVFGALGAVKKIQVIRE